MATRMSQRATKKARKKRMLPMPPPGQQLLSAEETAAVLGVGRDLVYKLIAVPSPQLYSFKLGARRVIPRTAVDLMIATKLADLKGPQL
jgi:hypothetical protein